MLCKQGSRAVRLLHMNHHSVPCCLQGIVFNGARPTPDPPAWVDLAPPEAIEMVYWAACRQL